MYKITIKETVGEITKETLIETDNIELVKEILVTQEILKVDSDAPNRNIDPHWSELQKVWKEARDRNLGYPGEWPYHSPFTITC